MSRSAAPADHSELIRWAGGATIVTRTQRLAREVRSQIGLAMAAGGTTVFETPDVLPVEAWFARLWEALDHDADVLRDSAERHLWREIIAADLESARNAEPVTPHQVAQLAESAAEAWQRMRRWQEPRWADMPLTPDVEAFSRWSATFADRLGQRWVSAAELPDRLAGQVRSLRDTVGRQIVLLGFERVEPGLRRLLDALEEIGIGIIEPAAVAGEETAPICVSAPTMEAEIRWLAARVRADIVADPSTSIGIFAADLSTYRGTLERYLSAELDPASLVPTGALPLPRQRRVFDLAGAPALSDYGIIAHALDLLALSYRDNAFSDVSRILLAPYPRIADTQERESRAEARARLELKLRRDNRLSVGLEALGDAAEATASDEFAKSVRALAKLLPSTPRSARPSAWVRHLLARLRCFDWPGPAIDHDADEGVAFGRWREVLDDFAALDVVCDSMSYPEAQTELRRLCSSIAVQAPSGGLGVQAMGLLDAAGLRFDKVYAVGMTADVFPAPAHPHPLLPAEWQRAAGLPLASAQVEAEFAASVWRRLRASCSQLIATWPRIGERGAHNVPSPVLAGAAVDGGAIAEDDEWTAPWYTRGEATEGIVFDDPDDGSVPPALVRRGGTGLIKDHAACPFRAFAGIRLKVERFDEPEPEPKANTRGTLVHRTLELVWGDLRESAALRMLDDTAIQGLVESAARTAVSEEYRGSDADTHDSLLRWLTQQVARWLVFERDGLLAGERADWRIGAVEERTGVPLGHYRDEPAVILRRLSVDRIDLLEDDSAVIIDYKTSSTASSVSQWADDRPKEPQLPIYAVALEAEGRKVAGVAFANLVSRDDVGYRGLADEALIGKWVAPEKSGWPGLRARIEEWERTLSALAEDYAAGNARVDPRSVAADCKWCLRQPLCRIFESDCDDDERGEDAD